MYCVEQTHAVADAIAVKDYEKAMELRSPSFKEAFRTLRTFVRALPHPPEPGQRRLRLAVMNAGSPAPGMNTAARAAIRLGIDKGHIMLAVQNGFQGLIDGNLQEMDWMSVNGWASMGGSELGTNRKWPKAAELYLMARTIEQYNLEGLMIMGGWSGYESAYKMFTERNNYPAFNLPIVCLPATINNYLPGTELTIGSDTALNSIVQAVDKIKQSGLAARRVFVVEVMGRYCGYLALMGGLATGAERVYIHEEGIKLRDLTEDVEDLIHSFKEGKRLGLVVRNEYANQVYSTPFMCALFEEEGGDLFDVRQAILGHLQQGGDPSPFDRIQATRFATRCIDYLIDQAYQGSTDSAFLGLQAGKLQFQAMEDFPRLVDEDHQRPKKQWWMDLRPIVKLLAQSGPKPV
jgi:6-phosphofructokinase 1